MVEGGYGTAAVAFRCIGPAAKVAAPALLKAVQRKRPNHITGDAFFPADIWPDRQAAITLVILDAYVGEQLDLITRALLYHLEIHAEQSDWEDVEEAALAKRALKRFGSECQEAIPALLDGLQREWYMRPDAADTLVRIQPPPEQVVPALQRILHEERQLHCT